MACRAAAARGIASVGRAVGRDPTITPSARSPATSPMPTIPSRRRRPCSRSDVLGMLRGYSGRRRGTNARTHERSVRIARPTAARIPSAASPAEWRPRPIASARGTGLWSGRPANGSAGRTGSSWWTVSVAASSAISIASIPSDPVPPRMAKICWRCSIAAAGRISASAPRSSSTPTVCAKCRLTSAMRSPAATAPCQVNGSTSIASPSVAATRRRRTRGSSSVAGGGGGTSYIRASRTTTALAGPTLATCASRPRTTTATTLTPARRGMPSRRRWW